MNQILSPLFAFSLFASLLVSCATSSPSLRSQDFSHLFEHRSGLIVPAEVLGADDPKAKCRMEFTGAQGRKQTLDFERGQDTYFMELPAGIYQVTNLSCGRGVYAIENQPPWARFVVNEGSLSYFSLLRFRLDQEAMVQHPSRKDSVEAFERTWKNLSPSDRQRLVFAMDGRKLTENMKEIQPDVSFHFHSPQPPANVAELKEPVLDCYRRETIQNHTLLGKTEYELSYRNGRLEKMTPGSRSSNTFSPQFFECLDKAFQDYRPAGAVNLKVIL